LCRQEGDRDDERAKVVDWQRRRPFESTVEAGGYELQFSLIVEGVELGLTIPGALHALAIHVSYF
jgi:hypothetical protein